MKNKKIVISLCIIFLVPWSGLCRAGIAEKAIKSVEESIEIRQKSQKQMDQWEKERSDLLLLYGQLQQEYETLVSENQDLMAAEQVQKNRNRNLAQQKITSLKIQKGLFPFVQTVYARLAALVEEDAPFLKEERAMRIKSLEKMMKDHGISVAEKYRRVMEALFVEAGYGSTIEVYQDKIIMGTETTIGNIFRLGRVSLFFLSLDRQHCARFNVAQNAWHPLSGDYLPAICSAVEIGARKKPVELLSLPLGRLALHGDNQ